MSPAMRKTEEVPGIRFLQRRRPTWHVRVPMPPSLVPRLGKQSIIRSLKTRDARVARERRWDAVAAIKREVAQLAGAGAADPVPLGLEYRFELVTELDVLPRQTGSASNAAAPATAARRRSTSAAAGRTR